jgi:hypothetical protein
MHDYAVFALISVTVYLNLPDFSHNILQTRRKHRSISENIQEAENRFCLFCKSLLAEIPQPTFNNRKFCMFFLERVFLFPATCEKTHATNSVHKMNTSDELKITTPNRFETYMEDRHVSLHKKPGRCSVNPVFFLVGYY